MSRHPPLINEVRKILRKAIEPVTGDAVSVVHWETATDAQGNTGMEDLGPAVRPAERKLPERSPTRRISSVQQEKEVYALRKENPDRRTVCALLCLDRSEPRCTGSENRAGQARRRRSKFPLHHGRLRIRHHPDRSRSRHGRAKGHRLLRAKRLPFRRWRRTSTKTTANPFPRSTSSPAACSSCTRSCPTR